MDTFLEKLNRLGIMTILRNGGENDEFDFYFIFTEMNPEEGLWFLGKVKGNRLILHQRLGMTGYDHDLGEFENIGEDTIHWLKEEYDKMKRAVDGIEDLKSQILKP